MTDQHAIGRDYILAGKATFTVSGRTSRFTFRVSRKEAEPGSRYGSEPTYFVGLLSGPDNTADYRYVGILDPVTGHVRLTRNSKVTEQAPSLVALRWTLRFVWAARPLPAPAAIYHEGHCGRCGRALTVPESILTGIGPECAAKMGIPMAVVEKQTPVRPSRPAHADYDHDGTEDYNELARREARVPDAAAVEAARFVDFLTSEL